MDQSARSERLTAFVSTVVAVAILAAGVTAHQSASSQVTDVVQLASDLRFHFEMAFRHNTGEGNARLARLDEVMATWQQSAQTEADEEALRIWLREAGARSLPGSMRELPESPKFSDPAPPLATTESRTVQKVPVEIRADEPLAQSSVGRETAVGVPTPAEPTHAAKSPTEAPITPTPADPLEEQAIELLQPPSIEPARVHSGAAPTLRKAPLPTVADRPAVAVSNVPRTAGNERGPGSEAVQVNLTELAARIAGYHESLDQVELALLKMDNPDLENIRTQVEELDLMTRDYGFVALYYESLTEAERASVIEPRPMQATLAEVARQLNRLERQLDDDFLGSADADSSQRIAKLRAKIAEIGNRVER